MARAERQFGQRRESTTQKTRSLRPQSWVFDGLLDRLLEHGHLLSQCEVLDGSSSSAHDERPEEEKDGLEDAHRLSLPRLRNGQSYWDASG